MSRFPPIPPSQRTPEQKQTQNQLESQGTVFGGEGLTRTDSDGTMRGPFVPLLYTPSICRPLLSFIPVIVNLPHLTPRVHELAILATASTYKVPFVLHAHSAIAQSVGLSPEQIAAASAGKLPGGLDAAEIAAWGFALRLATTPGPLNAETWDQARSCLGIEGVANLAHVVGAYAHMCLYQNAADIDWHGGYQM